MLSSIAALAGIAVVAAAPAPVPSGGVDTLPNATAPVYHTMSDYDFQSFTLGLNQEWIELDLFNYGLQRFSDAEFDAAGIDAESRSLIQFFANQEVGHATLLSNIVSYGGRTAAQQCQYQYDFDTVRDFVNFCQRLTRWGESGVYGFLSHLDSRPSANLLLQSIATEARQQFAFRQFSGAFPVPVYFETGISQAMQWTLLSRYLVSCPQGNPYIEWQNFPWLSVTNDANLLQDGYLAAISHNRTSLTEPGRQIFFHWDNPSGNISYDGMYNTSIGGSITTEQPQFVAFINQLNVTYAPLNVTGPNDGYAYQPGGVVYDNTDDGIINGTTFAALVSEDIYVTPYNLSKLNDYIFAFGEYQAN